MMTFSSQSATTAGARQAPSGVPGLEKTNGTCERAVNTCHGEHCALRTDIEFRHVRLVLRGPCRHWALML